MGNSNQNNRTKQKDGAFFDTSNYEGIETISSEERREILDSIEKALVREREGSGEGAPPMDSDPGLMEPAGLPRLGAEKRSAQLPIWMNVGTFMLLAASSLFIWSFFGAERGSDSPALTGIVSTEGLIVERLREEAQAELHAKDKELEEIRKRLKSIESEKLEVEEEIGRRLTAREEELRAEFRDGLEAERRRLITTGISGDQLVKDMADYETAAREEMEMKLAESRTQLEDEYGSRIAELDARHSLYEVQISNYVAELERLRTEVASLESEIQTLAENENSEALRTLKELQARREGEDGIRAQIAAYYGGVSDNWREGNSAATIELLGSLESYLNEPGIRQSEVVRDNRNVNSFFITAVRRLVNLEETVNDVGGMLLGKEPVFGPEDLELARNEIRAEAAEESRILEERLSAYLSALDMLRNDYAAAYEAMLENRRDDFARIASLLSDKLKIKSDLEPSAYALLDSFVESANALEVDGVREQIYGEFLEAIDELALELKP